MRAFKFLAILIVYLVAIYGLSNDLYKLLFKNQYPSKILVALLIVLFIFDCITSMAKYLAKVLEDKNVSYWD